jgi:SAM-dependent methyltransferase
VVDDGLLIEQLDYYRARAGEYDRWWNREGRFDRGEEANARWFAEAASLEGVLDAFDPRGDVLELACGTGLWTRHLLGYANTLTAVDGSAEVLAINRAQVGNARGRRAARRPPGKPPLRYVQADLFDWTPEPAGGYDVCFFSFWLSHVPEERFAAFWEMVGSALRPGGRVLFIDSLRAEQSKALDHVMPDVGEATESRRLDDGREFQIVKRYYEPRAVQSELASLGWAFQVATTGEFFIHGTGVKTSPVVGSSSTGRG